MNRITILCIEDEAEVREAVVRDLEVFEELFYVEEAEDVADARSVLQETQDEGGRVGLVLCDHVMPGENGVEFLVELNNNPATQPIKKVLLTGQAGQQDTIRAVNEANLDHYIAKPWTPEALHAVVTEQLTAYVIEQEEDLTPYIKLLDGPKILQAISDRTV